MWRESNGAGFRKKSRDELNARMANSVALVTISLGYIIYFVIS